MYGASLCLPGKFLASRKKAGIPDHGLSLFRYRIIWIWYTGNTNKNRYLPTCPERSWNINNDSLSLGTLLEHIPIYPLLKVFSKFLGIISTSFMTLKTTLDHSIPMKSSSLASDLNQCLSFSHSPLATFSAVARAAVAAFPWALATVHPSSLSQRAQVGWLIPTAALPVLSSDNPLPHSACWLYSTLFQYRVWHFFSPGTWCCWGKSGSFSIFLLFEFKILILNIDYISSLL